MECDIKDLGIHCYDKDENYLYCGYRCEFEGRIKSAIHTILDNWKDIANGKYDDGYLGYFSEGLADVRRNGLIGYINVLGEYVIPPMFNYVSGFYNNIAVVRIGRERSTKPGMLGIPGKCGVIDRGGNWILPPIYTSIDYFDDKLYCTTDLNRIEFRTYEGMLCFVRDYDRMTHYSNGASAVLVDERWGFINRNGEYILEPIYADFIICHEQNRFVVKLGEYWGMVDENHKILLPFIYDHIYNYENGYVRIGLNNKFGFLSPSFEDIIPCIYDFIYYNLVDIIGVMIKSSAKIERWGWCDMDGNVLVEPQYPDITLCNELIMISNNGKYGFVNRNNEIVIPCKYRYVSAFKNGLTIVKHRHKYGSINESGEMVIAAKYSDLSHFQEGYATVTCNDESYYINEKGERAIF